MSTSDVEVGIQTLELVAKDGGTVATYEIAQIMSPDFRAVETIKRFRFKWWRFDDNADIDPGTGYCNQNGGWGVEASIDHQSFWGSTYRLGIRFGYIEGSVFHPLTPIYWGGEQSHWNGAMKHHQGNGIAQEVKDHLSRINAAEEWVQRL